MTVIAAINFIEGPILISDSRATLSGSKASSDTATKIIPIEKNLIVGVAGNPEQASILLQRIFFEEKDRVGDIIFNPIYLRENVSSILSDVIPKYINGESRCVLVFAGIDISQHQEVPMEKIKQSIQVTKQSFVSGPQAFSLMTQALESDFISEDLVPFDFPRSFIFSLSYPSREITNVNLLELDCWGSGKELFKSHLEPDFIRLWDLRHHDTAPEMKTMILSATIQEIIAKEGESVFVGGLPQSVSVRKDGLRFHNFQMADFEMKFENGSWSQKDMRTGKVVKTVPSLLNRPQCSPEEIVNFLEEIS